MTQLRLLTEEELIRILFNSLSSAWNNSFSDKNRHIVFLIGSGAVLPDSSGFGIPSSGTFIELIYQELGIPVPDKSSYQKAFQQLLDAKRQDGANKLIQKAVLNAYTKSEQLSTPLHTKRELADLEWDNANWYIPKGILALASLCAHFPKHIGRTILTTNFDPLIEIALQRQKTNWYSTSLHKDGSLQYTRGLGTHVVHVHGDWINSDTLHTEDQLKMKRPKLKASLKRLLEDVLLVVIGYGGWDDIVMKSLREIQKEDAIQMDVLWGFYSTDSDEINKTYSSLFAKFDPSSNSRLSFFRGIDANRTLKKVFDKMTNDYPTETFELFLERVEWTLKRIVRYPFAEKPWGFADIEEIINDFVQQISLFGDKKRTALAALFAVEYVLPYFEQQPIHGSVDPIEPIEIRKAIQDLYKLMKGNSLNLENIGWLAGMALDAHIESDKRQKRLEKYVLMAFSCAICACLAWRNDSKEYSLDEIKYLFTLEAWAGKSVNLSYRVAYENDPGLWGYIRLRFINDYNHLLRFNR